VLKRLRPTAPISADVVLVGDPGRALMLAQELLQAPKMSNHARGLWGYTGSTPQGCDLTIQATGMGGPSAAVVLADLFDLGVRRAVRVGTCAALLPALELGDLLVAREALGSGGISMPDPELEARVRQALEETATARILSLDDPFADPAADPVGASGADMQTAAVFSCGSSLGIATAAILIVEEVRSGKRLSDRALETAAKRAGTAATLVLSS
jgi:uridine phosphorylase